jgi:PPOX class probable F420-dependent enzyme
MTPEERKHFLGNHRLAIAGVERKAALPHLSPVYYVTDGDDLLVSVTETRLKTKLIRRNGRLSLLVLHEQFPFPYLRVEGPARIENEGAVDLLMRVAEKMTGNPMSEAMRPNFEERARTEQRVVLRLTPESYYP